jgi:surface antigen
MLAKLWMVGVRRVPHSNQDTQASIESYHGALKRWLVLDTKGLRGRRLDWLVWRLTTTIARHYMHTLEMEKKGFHKKQGYGGHCYTKCGKGSPYSIHPCVPTNP